MRNKRTTTKETKLRFEVEFIKWSQHYFLRRLCDIINV